MNKVLTLGVSLLLAVGVAVAQDTSSSAQASSTSSGNQTTVQGCLRGSNDNWTLTDSNGQTWTLKGDDEKLKDHNGHTVAVTGTTNQSGMPQSGETAAKETAPAGNQTLTVTSVKHIADSCSESKSTTPPPSDMSSSSGPYQSSQSSSQSSQPPASSSTGSSLPPTSSSNGAQSSSSSSTQPPSSSTSSSSSDVNNQSSSPQSSTSQSSSQSSSLPQSGAASAENGIRGCLQGQSGSFTLRADDGRIFQLTGDTSKLNDNVNKEVEVTGNAGSSETSSNTAGQSSLNVTDVRKVADTCSSSGTGSAMPQSGATPPSSTSNPPSSTSKPPSSSSQPPSGPSDPDQDTAATQSTTPQSTTPQSGTPATDQNANPNANANATSDQNANAKTAKKGALPQTASPLPLMGLLGFGSLLSGMIVRKK